MDSEGNSFKPILSYAKEVGKATGLVTTCRVTHATPAGFAANVPKRGMEDDIARQYLEREIDVILGGGVEHFRQKLENGAILDLLPQFQEKGYELVRDVHELTAYTGRGGLLGLFTESHIPYALDRKHDQAHKDVPGLAQMFRAALARLDQAKDGFVLQVEAGRVDHAGHANDAGTILHEQLEFDECIPIALDYIDSHPDTLLVITTDHGTGGCQLDGAGPGYLGSAAALDGINGFKHSFEWLRLHLLEAGQFDATLVKRAFGIDATPEQAAIVQAAIDAKAKYLSGSFIKAFGPQFKELTAVGWTSRNHTSECVDLFAFGPGAQSLPGFIENKEIFNLMTDALGIRT
jgi:alkaline phosphatase